MNPHTDNTPEEKLSQKPQEVPPQESEVPQDQSPQETPQAAPPPPEVPSKALEDKLMRLQADFVNYQKRVDKEKVLWLSRANEGLLLALLPVVNDFQRALASVAPQEKNQTLKGLLLIHQKLLTTLEKQGVVPITIKAGDPITHEDHVDVISTTPVETPAQKGKVLQVVEQGYLLHGKILQRAKIIIGQ